MEPGQEPRITLIGAGTIGLSFAAFHLSHLRSSSHLTIYDTRPNAEQYIRDSLPKFFRESATPASISGVKIATNLQDAVSNAHIVQESGPENLQIKQELWAEVEKYAGKDALLWSSTSGIPASQQAQGMQDKTRLLVVHPYNPPHIMPLLELVPSPSTSQAVIERTEDFWRAHNRVPIQIHQETTGFVANRLAFALLREAIHLVDSGVVSVAELDKIVESSMVTMPGGGPAGLEGFFKNIGDTVQACWSDAGSVNVGDGWEQKVFTQAKDAYGTADVAERDRITRRLLDVLDEEKGKKSTASPKS
ncbi:hypothetical protein N0V90_002547 [Kalmusia sp. IMI 367209]|nr:hypothetical protein N0V90_002547 [Kalmusia sp. IMI 367209]